VAPPKYLIGWSPFLRHFVFDQLKGMCGAKRWVARNE